MNLKQYSIFISLSLIWGSSYFWIKIAVRESGPFIIVALRLLLALAVLFPFLIRSRAEIPRGMRSWSKFVIQGLFSASLPWVLITYAEQYIDSAEATVLNATVPMFTLVIAHFFLSDDRINTRKIFGLIVGFTGVALLVHKGLTVPRPPEIGPRLAALGMVAILFSSLSYGISNVYARVKFRGLPPIIQAFFSLLAADILIWAAIPTLEPSAAVPHKLLTWIAIIWLGFLGAGIGYLLFYRLLHEIGPTRVSMITYVIPLVGVLLGVIILKERLDASMAAGVVLIISGVWGVNKHSSRK